MDSRQYQIAEGIGSHFKEAGKGVGKKIYGDPVVLQLTGSSLQVVSGADNGKIRFCILGTSFWIQCGEQVGERCGGVVRPQ